MQRTRSVYIKLVADHVLLGRDVRRGEVGGRRGAPLLRGISAVRHRVVCPVGARRLAQTRERRPVPPPGRRGPVGGAVLPRPHRRVPLQFRVPYRAFLDQRHERLAHRRVQPPSHRRPVGPVAEGARPSRPGGRPPPGAPRRRSRDHARIDRGDAQPLLQSRGPADAGGAAGLGSLHHRRERWSCELFRRSWPRRMRPSSEPSCSFRRPRSRARCFPVFTASPSTAGSRCSSSPCSAPSSDSYGGTKGWNGWAHPGQRSSSISSRSSAYSSPP